MILRTLSRDEIALIWTIDRREVIHNFYQSRGCSLTDAPDPELFALEPEDIHLECNL